MTDQKMNENAGQPMGTGTRRSAAGHVMLFVGSLGYLGFVPIASGTVAVAVVGIPLYLLLVPYLKLSPLEYTAFIVVFTLVSIWVAGATDRILNEKDSHKNVIDEIPGYLIALVALPWTWQIIVVAFFLERAVDIAKIWPANWIERHLPRGWGVVLDDVVAGLYVLAMLHLGTFLLPGWFGVHH